MNPFGNLRSVAAARGRWRVVTTLVGDRQVAEFDALLDSAERRSPFGPDQFFRPCVDVGLRISGSKGCARAGVGGPTAVPKVEARTKP